jgi:hypothetical protein
MKYKMKIHEEIYKGIILVLVFSNVLLMILFNFKLGEVDVLAFVGSITGGVITLIGVQYTIKSSQQSIILSLQKQQEINTLQNMGIKISKLKSVKYIIHKTSGKISKWDIGFDENYKKIEKRIEEDAHKILIEFLDEFNKLLEDSADIDWYIFNDIQSFINAVWEEIRSDKKNPEVLDFIEKTFIDELMSKLDKHERRLSDEYESLTKEITGKK